MREALEIINFGGIKEATIELNPKITLLIGAQASGKSVVAKLFYYFKQCFTWMLLWDPRNGKYEAYLQDHFDEYFPVLYRGKGSFTIIYTYDSATIKIAAEGNLFQIEYNSFLGEAVSLYQKAYEEGLGQFKNDYLASVRVRPLAAAALFEYYERESGEILCNKQHFIVAGRSFFSLLQGGTLSFSMRHMDPITAEFGALYQSIREEIEKRPIAEDNTVRRLKGEILKGEYKVWEEKGHLLHDDNRLVEMRYASSGQQEALPLTLLLSFFARLKDKTGITVYIEEPEAHLFPSSQKSIVELIALIANKANIDIQFVITTHSPYVMSSFNNLLQAGEVLTLHPEKKEKVNKIISVDLALKYEEVFAYSLSDKTAISIMDEEMQLISSNKLDEISNEISIQFGNLLNL